MNETLQQKLTAKYEKDKQYLLNKEQEMDAIHQRIQQKQAQLTNDLECLDSSVNNTIKKFTHLNDKQTVIQTEMDEALSQIQEQKRELYESHNTLKDFTSEISQTLEHIKQMTANYTAVQTDTQSMLETFKKEKRLLYCIIGFIAVMIILLLIINLKMSMTIPQLTVLIVLIIVVSGICFRIIKYYMD